jgi:hypothetical protein
MVGAKRTPTKPGLGAVRSSRPPKTSKRPAPITVPSVRMPRTEAGPKRSSSSGGTKAQGKPTPSSRVGLGAVPVLTPNAGTRKDKKIEPSDAFLLSRIDGQLEAHELADLTGMSERDVIASLKRLVKAGLVTIA